MFGSVKVALLSEKVLENGTEGENAYSNQGLGYASL